MKQKPRVRKLASLPKRKADFIEPMDCAPVSHLPDDSQWLVEIKLDGYRAVTVKSDRGVDLFSRRHKSFNHQYPHLVEALAELPEGTVVDGEVVALDETGRPNFNLLQNFRSEAQHIHYFIFDSRMKVSTRRSLKDSPHSEAGNGLQESLTGQSRSRLPMCALSTKSKWLSLRSGSTDQAIRRER